MNDMEKIKERIKKLLNLSSSPNENEAALALKKAQELLEKYELSMSEVFAVTYDNIHEAHVHAGRRIPKWIVWLASMIAEIFELGIYRHYKLDPALNTYIPLLTFVGFEADLLVADYCFHFLRRAIEGNYRMKRAELRAEGAQRLPPGFKNSYALGFIKAVEEKIMLLTRCNNLGQQYVSPAQADLPVLKRNEIQKYMENLNLRKGRSNKTELNHLGYVLGVSDGSKASVLRPVTGNGSSALTD